MTKVNRHRERYGLCQVSTRFYHMIRVSLSREGLCLNVWGFGALYSRQIAFGTEHGKGLEKFILVTSVSWTVGEFVSEQGLCIKSTKPKCLPRQSGNLVCYLVLS